MLDIYTREYNLNSQMFFKYEKNIGLNKPSNFNKIEHLLYLDEDISFEEIVLTLSTLEDEFNAEIKSVNIKCPFNKRTFFELLDFYNSYDLQVNIITNDILTPFKVIHDMFLSSVLNSYHNYGLCIDIDAINKDIWFNKTILQTTAQYINTGYTKSSFYLK